MRIMRPGDTVSTLKLPELRFESHYGMLPEPLFTRTIPPILHGFWDDASLPAFNAECRAAWARLEPTWTQRLWTPDALPPMPPRYRAALETSRNWGEFSDILRYWLLYRFGGVWADLDTRPLRPLSPLIADTACFTPTMSAPVADPATCEQWLLGASPAHPFWEHVTRRLPEWIENNERGWKSLLITDGTLLKTGPWFLRAMLQEWQGQEEWQGQAAAGDRVTLFDSDLFPQFPSWNWRGDASVLPSQACVAHLFSWSWHAPARQFRQTEP